MWGASNGKTSLAQKLMQYLGDGGSSNFTSTFNSWGELRPLSQLPSHLDNACMPFWILKELYINTNIWICYIHNNPRTDNPCSSFKGPYFTIVVCVSLWDKKAFSHSFCYVNYFEMFLLFNILLILILNRNAVKHMLSCKAQETKSQVKNMEHILEQKACINVSSIFTYELKKEVKNLSTDYVTIQQGIILSFLKFIFAQCRTMRKCLHTVPYFTGETHVTGMHVSLLLPFRK